MQAEPETSYSLIYDWFFLIYCALSQAKSPVSFHEIWKSWLSV